MHERKRKVAEQNSCHQREKMRAAIDTYQHAKMDASSEKCLCNPPRSHDDNVKPALSLSLSLSLSSVCTLRLRRAQTWKLIEDFSCWPRHVRRFWSILWKKEERDYLESKLIIDALLCFVDRFLYAIRTHTGSWQWDLFLGFLKDAHLQRITCFAARSVISATLFFGKCKRT
jgi:hypothetical protein